MIYPHDKLEYAHNVLKTLLPKRNFTVDRIVIRAQISTMIGLIKRIKSGKTKRFNND